MQDWVVLNWSVMYRANGPGARPDVLVRVMESLQRGFGPAYAPAPLLKEMVEQGRLGRTVGRGFYAYDDGPTKTAG